MIVFQLPPIHRFIILQISLQKMRRYNDKYNCGRKVWKKNCEVKSVEYLREDDDLKP